MTSNSWNRPWSTQEIVDSASNWSLAGDAGLLKYLETFSEDLLTKAEDTNTNLNRLLDDLSNASLSLDVIKNEFSSLHNVQFVESRVYEEDETLLVDEQQENVKDKKLTEDERMLDMKDAVLRGIEVIDKYYEKVQVPASDSEDETDFPSFVLRPKDPYLDRPLPYIIGSEDWFSKWHVGLLDSSSDSETDKVSEKFSDSDSESDLPVQNRTQLKGISNSGSEADLSNRKSINPVANSTFDESVKQTGIFGSSDSEEYNSVPAQAPISNRSFAQELAAKLGNVIEQNTQVIEPEINKRPIQSTVPVPNRIIGNIFSDEPPPIDEDDIMFGKSNNQQGVFSGGGDLFDDLDNSSGLWGEKKDQVKASLEVPAPKSKLPNLFDDEDDDIFNVQNSHVQSTENISRNIISKKVSEDLFDEDSSEDDLFNEGTKHHSRTKPFLQPINKPTMPFFDNEPPELESKSVSSTEGNVKPKKPIGGVKIFEGADLFNPQKIGGLLKVRKQESSESSDKDETNTNKSVDESPSKITDKSKALFSELEKSIVNKQNNVNTAKKDDTKENTSNKPLETNLDTEKNLKQLSLFDDDNIGDDSGGLFGDDLFSNVSTKKFTSSLFEDKPLGSDLFGNVSESSKKSSSNDLFAEGNVSKPNKPSGKSSSTDLFAEDNFLGDVKISESSKPIEVKKEKEVDENNSQIFNDRVVVKEEKIKESSIQKDTVNLFHADSDDDIDDLFSINKITKSSQKPVAAPRNLKTEAVDENIPNPSDGDSDQNQNTEGQDSLSKNKLGSLGINFFDQNPPDDDNDDWDTKSDTNLFEENDPTLFDNTEISSHRSGLFDNEPPSLFYESSGIVRDVSARAETDDSFNPYASSSRRFSSDIFNEQQSNDSFFITKNKSHLDPQANLGSIQEISNVKDTGYSFSNVDITPSGNIDDLFSDSTFPVAERESSEKLQNDDIKNKSDDELFDEPSLEDSSESDLFAPTHKVAKDGNTKIKPSISTKPSSPLKKEDKTGESRQGSASPKIGSPGKLKHNLNINVGALLPGVLPPKRKDLEKSSSFDVASSLETSATEISSKSLSPTSTASKSSEELPQDVSPKKVNLESSSGLPEILPSITKDRVRIPIKRRPSTRKARQESIRNSGIDFKINIESEEGTKSDEDIKTNEPLKDSLPTENIFEKPKEIPKKDFIPHSKPNVSLFEDPFFTENVEKKFEEVPKKSIKKSVEEFDKPNTSLFVDSDPLFTEDIKEISKEDGKKSSEVLEKPDTKLFGDPLESDSLFTKITQEISKKDVKKSMEESLFDDPLEADPLFAVNTETKMVVKDENKKIEEQPKSSIFGEAKRSVINSDSFESADFKKSDLFDDSEEFDDIFSSKKLPPKSNILKKSLFDDELDDDDIFGPSSSNERSGFVKNTGGSKAPQKKSAKITQVKKLENKATEEDPLSSFND